MGKKSIKPSQVDYKNLTREMEPKRPVIKNTISAFLVGGFICTLG